MIKKYQELYPYDVLLEKKTYLLYKLLDNFLRYVLLKIITHFSNCIYIYRFSRDSGS